MPELNKEQVEKELHDKLYREWIKHFNLSTGKDVIVISKGNTRELGWGHNWGGDIMDNFIGRKAVIRGMDGHTRSIIVALKSNVGDSYYFPYNSVVPYAEALNMKGKNALMTDADEEFDLSNKQAELIKRTILGVD